MKFKKYIKTARIIAIGLIKQFQDESSDELVNWIEEEPFNKELLEKIVDERNWAARDKKIQLLDKDLIWQNIQQKIDWEEKPQFPFRKILQYAAAVILLMAMSYGGWYFYKKMPFSSKTEFARIEPGKAKARLILNNNDVIELGINDTILQTQDENIKIDIDSGRIDYRTIGLSKQKGELHTIVIPRGGEMFLNLSDGTKVWLNSETTLIFPTVFDGPERRVKLIGEALFDVAEDSEHPFIVNANGINVKALGTKFNISAYSDDDFVHATLVEGKVLVSEQISGSLQSAYLMPSQQALLYRSRSQKLIIKTVDTELYTSWAKGKFIFRNEPLDLILHKLSRWYNVDVFYDDFNVKKSKFSGKIPRFENCETILKLMEETNSVKFETTESTILVKSTK